MPKKILKIRLLSLCEGKSMVHIDSNAEFISMYNDIRCVGLFFKVSTIILKPSVIKNSDV